MEKYKKFIVRDNEVLKQALIKMDHAGEGLLLVVSKDDRVCGIIADGDIRRALIRGTSLEVNVSQIMNSNFKYWPAEKSIESGVTYLFELNYKYLPVLDKQKKLIDIIFLEKLNLNTKKNPVVIMAGGLGTRLRPLTDKTPKPMLSLNGQPFLEIILNNLINQGFVDFYISVNYLAEQIIDFFGDGDNRGVRIHYLQEKKRLGTAGSLGLIKSPGDLPLIVMNGDLITRLNFRELLDYHDKNESALTLGVREMEFQIPFGVIETKNQSVLKISEKPVKKFLVNAGIYVVDPSQIIKIPKNEFLDMPDFVNLILEDGYRVDHFPIYESWIDIGRKEDYEMIQSGKFKT